MIRSLISVSLACSLDCAGLSEPSRQTSSLSGTAWFHVLRKGKWHCFMVPHWDDCFLDMFQFITSPSALWPWLIHCCSLMLTYHRKKTVIRERKGYKTLQEMREKIKCICRMIFKQWLRSVTLLMPQLWELLECLSLILCSGFTLIFYITHYLWPLCSFW